MPLDSIAELPLVAELCTGRRLGPRIPSLRNRTCVHCGFDGQVAHSTSAEELHSSSRPGNAAPASGAGDRNALRLSAPANFWRRREEIAGARALAPEYCSSFGSSSRMTHENRCAQNRGWQMDCARGQDGLLARIALRRLAPESLIEVARRLAAESCRKHSHDRDEIFDRRRLSQPADARTGARAMCSTVAHSGCAVGDRARARARRRTDRCDRAGAGHVYRRRR